jgi:hypothetical protein
MREAERCFALAKPRAGIAKAFCDGKKLFVIAIGIPRMRISSRKLCVADSAPHITYEKTALMGGFLLFLALLENDVLAELLGVLFKLYFARNELLVLARPIHLPRGGVLELYEAFLRHCPFTLPNRAFFGN